MIASETPEVQKAFLDALDQPEILALPYIFEFWAHEHQLPPEGNWRTWVVMGGRGAGKTRAGAEWVRSQVEGSRALDEGEARRVALVADTFDQVRDVMIFGESGILACSPSDRRPVWEATRRRLVWPNGATAQAFSANDPEGLRGPQFDAAWVDEIGCPAVDKGSNEPNKFVDPKSSESALPKYSSGRRDDFIQHQYLKAVFGYWDDASVNPVSNVYGAPMVDTQHAFVWAWDARPYPHFPGNAALWSDGANYQLGHWLNGRTSSRSLASVVAEICRDAGIANVDVTGLYGMVRGYTQPQTGTGRAALQPLMLAYGFDAIERDGTLVFRTRTGRVAATIASDDLAFTGEISGDLEKTRAPSAETVGRLRLNSIEAEGDYQVRASEAIFPDEATTSVAQSDLPLVLTGVESQAITERWLSEARVARDTARFALPPSVTTIGAGDVIETDAFGAKARFRIDQVDHAGLQMIEAVRVEAESYQPSDAVGTAPQLQTFAAPVPVFATFMDLPLLTGGEVPHAPHIAVSAKPFPGSVSVFKANGDAGFSLNRVLTRQAVMGRTETPLFAAEPAIWDRGAALRVRLFGGALSSASEADVLNGANAAAISDGQSDAWEIFQFQSANLIEAGVYELSLRLRGQLGTDALIPPDWPPGSLVVFLDGAQVQLDLAASERGVSRTYRVGPSARPYDDPSYVVTERAFAGIGLRPYSPVHLRATGSIGNDIALGWLRRTRIDGDSWEGIDVPLGEASESYLLRVVEAGQIRREVTVTGAAWTYTAADQSADGIAGPFAVDVAQLSDRFGAGLFKRIEINEYHQ